MTAKLESFVTARRVDAFGSVAACKNATQSACMAPGRDGTVFNTVAPVLTFRGIAGLSRFSWVSLECNVTGTVDRVDRVTQFTAFEVRARLRVPSDANEEQARRLLTKAEETCLVTNSLKVRPHLESVVEIEEP